jgi:MarR family transcriptional regulator, temperature-dependent positive regulator of motility
MWPSRYVEILERNRVPYAYRLIYLSNYLAGPVYKQIESRFGVTRPQFVVLSCLAHMSGLNAKDITEASGRPKNSISRAVNELLAANFIQREIDPRDRRHHILEITNLGRDLFEQMVPMLVEREKAMTSVLTEAELKQFDRILRKMVIRNDGWAEVY